MAGQGTPGAGNGQVPPGQSDLSLWQALREDLQGKMVDLVKYATGCLVPGSHNPSFS